MVVPGREAAAQRATNVSLVRETVTNPMEVEEMLRVKEAWSAAGISVEQFILMLIGDIPAV